MVLLRWISLLLMLSCQSGRQEFPEMVVPLRNPTSEAGIKLGRTLFYDPILSADSTISCASCHIQALAFTDGEVTSTSGRTQQPLIRHTPTLTNTGFSTSYFWDGGSPDLESQVFLPLTHPDEMGSDLSVIVKRIGRSGHYVDLFENAFDTDSVTIALVARALAQFQRQLISRNASYDRVMLGLESFTETEEKGLALFMEQCATCHTPPLFTDNGFHNNGIDSTYVFADDGEMALQGRFRISYDSMDMGKFKTPTLRNVAITAPYMHDGRFETLKDVLQHYASEIKASRTLDQSLSVGGLGLSQEDQKALIQFLATLSDPDFLSNPDFGPIGGS